MDDMWDELHAVDSYARAIRERRENEWFAYFPCFQRVQRDPNVEMQWHSWDEVRTFVCTRFLTMADVYIVTHMQTPSVAHRDAFRDTFREIPSGLVCFRDGSMIHFVTRMAFT